MNENFIKYSDFIKPDDSFDKLIGKLNEIKNQYKDVSGEISAAAKQLANDIKSANSTTASGRAAIEAAAAASERYASATDSLKVAMNGITRVMSDLKAREDSITDITVRQGRAIETLTGKYTKLSSSLASVAKGFHDLETAQKSNLAAGGALLGKLNDILSSVEKLGGQVKVYADYVKETSVAMNDLRKGMSGLKSGMSSASQSMGSSASAMERQSSASKRIDENLQKLNLSTREANLLAKYKAQLDGHVVDVLNLEASTYNQLSAQYGINKIALNKLTGEQRLHDEASRKLEADTYAIYQQMKKLQEQTGKNTLSVGDYNKVWDGLRYQTQQVVRELPSLTVSLNQFFLAISNNIPLLVDEVRRFKEEGNSSKDAIKRIVSSLFSWQTALIVGLTLLARYGKQIGEFIKSLAEGRKASYSFAEALRDINKEVSNVKVGDEIAKFQALRKEWNNLSDSMSKATFLKERKTDIEALGASATSAAQAENLFNANADTFVNAMMVRAKAIAAATIAGQAYQDWVEKSLAAESIRYNQQRGITKVGDFFRGLFSTSNYVTFGEIAQHGQRLRIQSKEQKAASAWQKGTRVTTDFQSRLEEEYKRLLGDAGIDTASKGATGTAGRVGRDLQSYIDNMVLRLKKAHNDILEAIGPDSYTKQLQKINDDYEEKSKELQNIIDKNNREISNSNKKYTADQKNQLIEANVEAQSALADLRKKYEYELNKLNTQHKIDILRVQNAASDLRRESEDSASEVAYQERLSVLRRNMEMEILQNSLLTEEEMQKEYDIRRKWNRKMEELQIEHASAVRKARLGVAQNVAAGAPADLGKRLTANLYAQDVSYSNELDAFETGPKEQQTQEAWDAIIAKHTAARKRIYAEYFSDVLSQQQAAEKAEFESVKHSEYQITVFTLEQEKERLLLRKQLYEQGVLDLSEDQLRELLAQLKKVSREQKEALSDLLQDTVGGTIMSALGFDDESISQFTAYKDQIIGQLNELLQAEIDMANKEIELQQGRVDAAQNAYDAEVRARANGYANSVASAKKELQLQQSTLAKKKAQAEKYQKAQQALDTAQQASSLVTATANLWSSLSSIPIVGPVLAAVATAGMFAAFIASKVKATQLTATYGDGGMEILNGGSHASGNDIDLGVKNSQGKRMKAEGGEAMVIISKRKTRKYRSILPDVVDSLNQGTFEEKYMRPSSLLAGTVVGERGADLGNLERGVDKLVRQGNSRTIQVGDRIIIIEGNTKKTIKLA